MTVPNHPHPTPRAPPRRVLEDASGRRLRRMRWVGRATAILFLVWLTVVILGGLGVGPAGRLPLGRVLRPSAGPPPLRTVPQPVAPAPSDLVPALPQPAAERSAVPGSSMSTTPGKSGTAPGRSTTTTTTTPGKSGVAPGRTTTSPGKSGGAPGRRKQTTTTTTAPTTTAPPGKGRGKKP